MVKKYKIIKEKLREKAKKDISLYFKKAKEVFSSDKEKANDYVRKARRLAMKHNIRLSSALKRKFCGHCYSYLMVGVNARVRTRDCKLVYYCRECKRYNRFGIGKKAK